MTEALRGSLSQILGVDSQQVMAVGEYEFVDKSLIIELAPDVDLASLKVDPKALVRSLCNYSRGEWTYTLNAFTGPSFTRLDYCHADGT